jgi:hypothetical protein
VGVKNRANTYISNALELISTAEVEEKRHVIVPLTRKLALLANPKSPGKQR